jgi:hypothetical protein
VCFLRREGVNFGSARYDLRFGLDLAGVVIHSAFSDAKIDVVATDMAYMSDADHLAAVHAVHMWHGTVSASLPMLAPKSGSAGSPPPRRISLVPVAAQTVPDFSFAPRVTVSVPANDTVATPVVHPTPLHAFQLAFELGTTTTLRLAALALAFDMHDGTLSLIQQLLQRAWKACAQTLPQDAVDVWTNLFCVLWPTVGPWLHLLLSDVRLAVTQHGPMASELLQAAPARSRLCKLMSRALAIMQVWGHLVKHALKHAQSLTAAPWYPAANATVTATVAAADVPGSTPAVPLAASAASTPVPRLLAGLGWSTSPLADVVTATGWLCSVLESFRPFVQAHVDPEVGSYASLLSRLTGVRASIGQGLPHAGAAGACKTVRTATTTSRQRGATVTAASSSTVTLQRPRRQGSPPESFSSSSSSSASSLSLAAASKRLRPVAEEEEEDDDDGESIGESDDDEDDEDDDDDDASEYDVEEDDSDVDLEDDEPDNDNEDVARRTVKVKPTRPLDDAVVAAVTALMTSPVLPLPAPAHTPVTVPSAAVRRAKRRRLHSKNRWVDQHLAQEKGDDSFMDLADWVVDDDDED